MIEQTAGRRRTPNVEGVFQELECVGPDGAGGCSHGGGTAAWYEGHDCCQGWLCAAHLKYHLLVQRPKWVALLAAHRVLQCAGCRKRFTDVESLARVWPMPE